MTYPPAPWKLKGYAIQSLHLVNIIKARRFIPPELEIVSVLPGKTIGVVYLSAYESGSTLEYNELIVAPASVRYQDKSGSWISHIYVDNEDSVAGGKEIWGLPKEIAEFTWDNNNVIVRQNDKTLCQLHFQKGFLRFSSWWRQKFRGNCFGGLKSDLLYFQSEFESKINLINSKLEIAKESPFANLELGTPWLTLKLTEFQTIAGIPKIVGNKVPQSSYQEKKL
ncbi:MAG: acetoacetate decarboxylase family protein [Moorea sp. SIO2B7]|nr:acetoacetate decarboxylase family protein [Moorena sp. SIO2B7]